MYSRTVCCIFVVVNLRLYLSGIVRVVLKYSISSQQLKAKGDADADAVDISGSFAVMTSV